MRTPPIVAGLASLLALGACDDSIRRSDLVATSGGDAVAANRAMHIIDPWPRASSAVTQPTRGVRIGSTLDRYREGKPTANPDALIGGAPASRTTN